MNTYTIEKPTLETLSDLFALHPAPLDVAKRLSTLRENVAAGRVLLENVLILRSERGIEGTALIPRAVQVPVFPCFRSDASSDAMTALACAVRERSGPERVLVLQDDQGPLNAAAIETAGWRHDSTEVIYETDLTARRYEQHPDVWEPDHEGLRHPGLQHFLAELGRADLTLRDGWRLVVLSVGTSPARPVALGAYGPSRPGYGGVDMIGVLPTVRGRGLGTQLHAHLLACLAPDFARHGGITSADNAPMRRIYQKNGSQLVATQLYFRPS